MQVSDFPIVRKSSINNCLNSDTADNGVCRNIDRSSNSRVAININISVFRCESGKQLALVICETAADTLRERSQFTRAGEDAAIGSKDAVFKEGAQSERGCDGRDSGTGVMAGLIIAKSENDLVGDLASGHAVGQSGGAGGQESSRGSSNGELHFE